MALAIISYNAGQQVAYDLINGGDPSQDEILSRLDSPAGTLAISKTYKDPSVIEEKRAYLRKVLSAVSYFSGTVLFSNNDNAQNLLNQDQAVAQDQPNQNQVAPTLHYIVPASAPSPSGLGLEYDQE